jgi:hypothetical protein
LESISSKVTLVSVEEKSIILLLYTGEEVAPAIDVIWDILGPDSIAAI